MSLVKCYMQIAVHYFKGFFSVYACVILGDFYYMNVHENNFKKVYVEKDMCTILNHLDVI